MHDKLISHPEPALKTSLRVIIVSAGVCCLLISDEDKTKNAGVTTLITKLKTLMRHGTKQRLERR